jgi:hypothetical protein
MLTMVFADGLELTRQHTSIQSQSDETVYLNTTLIQEQSDNEQVVAR